jgi:hypothetical protein
MRKPVLTLDHHSSKQLESLKKMGNHLAFNNPHWSEMKHIGSFENGQHELESESDGQNVEGIPPTYCYQQQNKIVMLAWFSFPCFLALQIQM